MIQGQPISGKPRAADAMVFGTGGDHIKAETHHGPTAGQVDAPSVGIYCKTVTLGEEAFGAARDGTLAKD